jgi:hypothetical protein
MAMRPSALFVAALGFAVVALMDAVPVRGISRSSAC